MIDLVFNILNLIVFVSLLAYAFYHYILPSCKVSFFEHEQDLINLAQQKDALINQQEQLVSRIIEQEKLCIILKSKITLWKQSTENAQLIKNNNEELCKLKLREKLARQSQFYQYEQIKTALTPELIESLTKNLEDHFKSPENREAYFANIFKEFNKE